MRSLWLALFLALPAFMLHADRWAQVSIPVTCMRSAPGHASEQCSQAILGYPLRVTDEQGDWYRVKSADGYAGWVRSNTVVPLTQEEFDDWRKARRVVCRSWLTRLFDREVAPAGYAPYGSILLADGPQEEDSAWLAVRAPGSETPLRVKAEEVWEDTSQWTGSFANADAYTVINAARSMLGAPYLWGGTSSLAPDCSGFTQTAFMAAGMLLPRDTYMQVECGVEVPSLDQALPGDLVFYGNDRRVNHVAIYLGNKRIIHSSGHVRVCRMEPLEGDEELYTDTPMCIRRVLGVPSATAGEAAPGVPAIAGNPWFF